LVCNCVLRLTEPRSEKTSRLATSSDPADLKPALKQSMESAASAETIQTVAPAVKRGRFSVNLAANLGHLGLSIVVGVVYVPFLVRHLGPAAYGLIPLASTITSYMALITLGLNAAVGRSLTVALEQGNHEQANRIFNTSFWGGLTLCGGLLLPAGLGLVFLDSIIRVPPGFESQNKAGRSFLFFIASVNRLVR
jgi:membrane protein EpsK